MFGGVLALSAKPLIFSSPKWGVICFDTHTGSVQLGEMTSSSTTKFEDAAFYRGGTVPGMPGMAAYQLKQRHPSPVPVLIAVPHAGRAYPTFLIERMRDPAAATLRLEDRYVDLLARRVADATGAGLLVAHAPRALIDLNRAPEEVDWTMLIGGGKGHARVARRARSGLGLVPRRLSGMGEIWKSPLPRDELDGRIATIHCPYHQALEIAMDSLVDRWGAALLVDLHSMPPLDAHAGKSAAELVIGDRFGASCDGALVSAAFAQCDAIGVQATHNRPYAGGYVLDRHGKPGRNRHAMQFEICRRAYLDVRLAEPGDGLENMAQYLTTIVRKLAAEVASIGHGGALAQAAE